MTGEQIGDTIFITMSLVVILGLLLSARRTPKVSDEAPPGMRWTSDFLMAARGSSESTRITDVRSVEIHPSGLWVRVDMGGTIAWMRIPPEMDTIEWQDHTDLIQASTPDPRRRAAILRWRKRNS